MARPVTDPEIRCIVFYLFEECAYTAPVLGEFFNLSESAIYSRVAQGRAWAKHHRSLYSNIKSVLAARGYVPKKDLNHLTTIPELSEYIPSVLSEDKGLECIVDSIIDNPEQYSITQSVWMEFSSNQLARLWKLAIVSTDVEVNLRLLSRNEALAKKLLFRQDLTVLFKTDNHPLHTELMNMRDLDLVCKLLDDIYTLDDKTFLGRISDVINIAIRTCNNTFNPNALARLHKEGWRISTSIHGQPQLIKNKHVIWF